MIRRFTIIAVAMFLLTDVEFSQTLKITTFGVSPREAGLSETDIYISAYNGLTNVGVGTTMYLKATLIGGRLNNPTFTAVERAPGSVAANLFGANTEGVDTSTIIFVFKPDKPGKYVVQVSDAPYTATITINAANYIGVLNTVNNVNCETCHPTYVQKWSQTGHSNMLVRGLEGTLSSHYGSSCISCHTTGYDASATNNGFDDFGFTFPTVLTTGTYQSMNEQFPEAMLRANIQCEACHGPASGHFGETKDSRIQTTFDAANCAICHDDGHYHVYPQQWDYSRHAVATNYPSGPGRESCVRCHTAKGFAQYAKGIATNDPYFDPSYQPITCAGCHDPHDVTNENQLRKVTVKLINDVEITTGGKGRLCMNCHQSRTNANDSYVAKKASYPRFGSHYSDPADIINGENVYKFGKEYGFTDHIGIAENGCVTCHMAEGATDPDVKIQLSGKHTFSMSTPSGQDNMLACAPCHGSSLGANFDDVRYFPGGKGDLDEDGTIEGLQVEIHGMLDRCLPLLPTLSNPSDWAHSDPDSNWTTTQRMAFYNMKAVYYDGSFGIHNPDFIYSLLVETYRQLGGVVGIEDELQTVPTEYVLYTNYPNPFNPSTNIKFSLPKASNVRLTIYDTIGREVRTLINNELSAGTHTIQWNASNLASGIYLYKIEAGDYVKVNKMLLLK